MVSAILEKIHKADNLPSLPHVAVEILRLSRSDDVSMEDLAEVIQTDPALTVKVLKMVNSSLFGVPREVTSVGQAVSMLGMRTVKVLALSFSLVNIVEDKEGQTFDFQAYWRRSLSTAVASRLLGKAVAPQQAEEAFVAGLLSDLGSIAAWQCAQDLYLPVVSEWSKGNRALSEIEAEELGLTHAFLSSELLRHWGLPETLCDTVAAHHGEGLNELSGSAQQLAKIVHSASIISDLFCQEIPSSQLDEVKSHCVEETGIDDETLEELLGKLDEHVQEAASMLSVRVGDTVNYGQLQAEASVQLAQLSMQAEVERMQSTRQAEEARQKVERLHEENRVILKAASMDGLTKVANRAAFDNRLSEEIERAKAEDHPLVLIIMDVDRFKRFNDTYGHQAGDEVLRAVAMSMQDTVKGMGFVARYGGEEFAAILPGKIAATVRSLAEAIRQKIEATVVVYDGRELSVTASLGVALRNPRSGAFSSEKLIEEADKNLYKAKQEGRNRVEMTL